MKRRLAYFSPLPPARTGIADYSRELLPHLARHAEVCVFSNENAPPADPKLAGIAAFPPADYVRRRWDYDLPVYQIGNSRYHETTVAALLRYPGIVVLHDYGLHQLWAGQTVALGNMSRYTREMGYSLGLAGIAWAREAVAGRTPLPHFAVPLSERLVDMALGVIVHSKYAEQLIRRRNERQRVAVVPAPVVMDQAPSPRAELGLPVDACLFGSFGVVSHTKQLEAALVAFSAVRRANANCYYLIVGEWTSADVDVPELVEGLGLGEAVKYTGFASCLTEFLGWLAAVDVVINLRYPTVGETSAVALRALAAARALVVYDHGWYSELPAEACLKLPPLDQEALTAAMLRLAGDVSYRTALAERGRAYVREHHTPEQAASGYAAFVEQVLAGLRGSTV